MKFSKARKESHYFQLTLMLMTSSILQRSKEKLISSVKKGISYHMIKEYSYEIFKKLAGHEEIKIKTFKWFTEALDFIKENHPNDSRFYIKKVIKNG